MLKGALFTGGEDRGGRQSPVGARRRSCASWGLCKTNGYNTYIYCL